MDKDYLCQVDIREWTEDGLDVEIMVCNGQALQSLELCKMRKEQCVHLFERKKTVRTWIVFFREFWHAKDE